MFILVIVGKTCNPAKAEQGSPNTVSLLAVSSALLHLVAVLGTATPAALALLIRGITREGYSTLFHNTELFLPCADGLLNRFYS